MPSDKDETLRQVIHIKFKQAGDWRETGAYNSGSCNSDDCRWHNILRDSWSQASTQSVPDFSWESEQDGVDLRALLEGF